MSPAPEAFLYLLICIVGLCLGSFATALIYRIPRGISWIANNKSKDNPACRSECPHCHHRLGVADLVPLFSWLFSGGKCRHCGHAVSTIYPAVEIITAVCVTVLSMAWGPVYSFVPLMFAVPFMVAAVVIDWEHMILPNDINIALAILAGIFIFLLAQDNQALWISHVTAAIVLPVFFWLASWAVGRLKRKQALGQGDLKFLPVAGLFLGVPALASFMVTGGVLGVLSAFLRAKRGSKGAFPFGPALIASLYLHLILTGLGFDYKW